jgi:hypothetical protein
MLASEDVTTRDFARRSPGFVVAAGCSQGRVWSGWLRTAALPHPAAPHGLRLARAPALARGDPPRQVVLISGCDCRSLVSAGELAALMRFQVGFNVVTEREAEFRGGRDRTIAAGDRDHRDRDANDL